RRSVSAMPGPGHRPTGSRTRSPTSPTASSRPSFSRASRATEHTGSRMLAAGSGVPGVAGTQAGAEETEGPGQDPRDAHLAHAQPGGDLVLGEFAVETEADDLLFPFGQPGDDRGQHPPVLDEVVAGIVIAWIDARPVRSADGMVE